MKKLTIQKTFKFKSYEENSHPILYFKDIEDKILYDAIVKSLLDNCITSYLCAIHKLSDDIFKPCIQQENIFTTPVFSKKTNNQSLWKNIRATPVFSKKTNTHSDRYLYGSHLFEDSSINTTGVQVLPLDRDASIYNLRVRNNNGQKDKARVIEQYNSKRERVLNQLKEIGNPPMMIETDGAFMYIYVHSSVFFVVPRTHLNPKAYHVHNAVPYLSTLDEICILQTLCMEIVTLPKEEQTQMVDAFFRLFVEYEERQHVTQVYYEDFINVLSRFVEAID